MKVILRSRDLVHYQGDDLIVPHLCCEIVEYADLRGADFADLRGADFAGLFMYNAVFSHCQLAGADFTGAHLMDTAFLGCRDLHEAAGLDSVEHDGASVLDVQTLRECSAALSDAFLTGIGYTPEKVETLHASAQHPAR